MDAAASGVAIDRQVKQLQGEATSLYQLDVGQLKQLRPDIILTQAQCEVCAISLAEVEQAVRQWPGNAPQIVATAVDSLLGVKL